MWNGSRRVYVDCDGGIIAARPRIYRGGVRYIKF